MADSEDKKKEEKDDEPKPKPHHPPKRHVRDTFLVDAVRPKPNKHISYADGFRFGIGMATAFLLIAILTGGLAWALVVAFKLGA